MRPTILDRFWAKVDRRGEHDCWNWKGSATKDGYGQIGWGRGPMSATRASWCLHFGKDPRPFQVLHECDNPRCINPKHLFLGTHDDNMKDMAEKRRGNAPRRSKSSKAKITEDQYREILKMRSEGTPLKLIAPKFGMSVSGICRLTTGSRWKIDTVAKSGDIARSIAELGG